MLLIADTSCVSRAEHLEVQNPREIVQIAQRLLRIENRDSAWHGCARLEIVTLQQLIQQERYWLNASTAPGARRHLRELINDTMTCLLSLEFAVAARLGG